MQDFDLTTLIQSSAMRFQSEIAKYCIEISPKLNECRDVFSRLISTSSSYSALMNAVNNYKKPFLKEPDIKSVISHFDKKGECLKAIEVSKALINSLGKENVEHIFLEMALISSAVRNTDSQTFLIKGNQISVINTETLDSFPLYTKRNVICFDDDIRDFLLVLGGQTIEQSNKVSMVYKTKTEEPYVTALIRSTEFPDIAARAIVEYFNDFFDGSCDYDDIFEYLEDMNSLNSDVCFAFYERIPVTINYAWSSGFGRLFISILDSNLCSALRYSMNTDSSENKFEWNQSGVSKLVASVQEQVVTYFK
ncbi:hypothetical protein ACRTC7_03190 [Vibrio fluvialis]|uniref:hypothetical protein n=1 Tax=Vibrio fluvialis TaxID=676 RepID=UPI003D7CEBE0